MSNEDSFLVDIEGILRRSKLELSDYALINDLFRSYLNKIGARQPIYPVPDMLKQMRNYQREILIEFGKYFFGQNYIPRMSEIDPHEGRILDADEAAWRVLFLRIYNQDTQICPYFPQTMLALSKIPCITAMLSILEPKKQLPTHEGYYCGVLRYHLGLVIPEPSCMVIDGKEYKWEPDLLFDDTYPHSAKNLSDKNRIILLLDIPREFKDPYLNDLNQRILKKASESQAAINHLLSANEWSPAAMAESMSGRQPEKSNSSVR